MIVVDSKIYSLIYLVDDLIGTTTAHPHGDENLRPVELGASIFVEANRHLVKAAKVSAERREAGRSEAEGCDSDLA